MVRSNRLPVDRERLAASPLMIAPPPGTETALLDVDPRRLAASFRRGETAIDAGDAEQKVLGARLIEVAASLGFAPARGLIARDYPRSSPIRSAVPAPEAVRFSLDPLFSRVHDTNAAFTTLLAAYFSGRHELKAYSTYLLDALGDDRRLQSADALKSLLADLARVPGACMALAQAVAGAQTIEGAECSPALPLQIGSYLAATPPAGLDAQSRRQALRMLETNPRKQQSRERPRD